MEKNIVAIDMGTTRTRLIACVADPTKPYGLGILHREEMDSQGIRRGAVQNKDEVSKVLNNLLLGVEKKTGTTTSRKKGAKAGNLVVTNIGGRNFATSVCKKSMGISGVSVTPRVLQSIERQARDDKDMYMTDESILRMVVIGYSIDNEPDTDDVINRVGGSLEAKYLCISGQKSAMEMVASAYPLKAKPAHMYPSTSSKAQVLLSPAQRREGVALVDMGGGSTSVAVFFRDSLRYEVSIPIGSDTITSDIAKGLGINPSVAENLKRKVGMFDEGETRRTYEITSDGDSIKFTGQQLNFIIRARVEELGAYVYSAIQEAMRRGCPKDIKLCLTGGGALLRGVRKIMAEQTAMALTNVTLASLDGMTAEEVEEYAGAIGMASIFIREEADSQVDNDGTLPFDEEVVDDRPAETEAAAAPQAQAQSQVQPQAQQPQTETPKADTTTQKDVEEKGKKKNKFFSTIFNKFDNMMNDDLNSK